MISGAQNKVEWIQEHSKGCILKLYIQPGASRSEFSGIHGDRIKLKIKSPPRDGEANEELIEFLGKYFKISKSRVFLLRGESSRQKDLLLELPLTEAIKALPKLD